MTGAPRLRRRGRGFRPEAAFARPNPPVAAGMSSSLRMCFGTTGSSRSSRGIELGAGPAGPAGDAGLPAPGTCTGSAPPRPRRRRRRRLLRREGPPLS